MSQLAETSAPTRGRNALGALGTNANEVGSAKSRLWPKPDWNDLVASGVSPAQAAFVKIVRSRFPANPVDRGSAVDVDVDGRYEKAIAIVREVIETPIRGGLEAVYLAVSNALRREMDPISRTCRAIRPRQQDQFPFVLRDEDHVAVEDMLDQGFPVSTPNWTRGVTVRRETEAGFTVYRKEWCIGRDLPTSEAAFDHARRHFESSKAFGHPYRAEIVAPRRVGVSAGDGPFDIEDFARRFDLRAVFFAHGVSEEAQAEVVERATHALAGMCEALGVDETFVGAIASGGVDFRAGALSATRIAQFGKTLPLPSVAAGGSVAHAFGSMLLAGGDLSPETLAPFQALQARIQVTPLTVEEMEDRRSQAIAEVEVRLTAARSAYESAPVRSPLRSLHLQAMTTKPDRSRIAEKIASLEAEIGDLRSRDVNDFQSLRPSHYRAMAGDRRDENASLFARAFECWVADTLTAQGKMDEYLVHGVEEGRHRDRKGFDPYPAGEDRRTFAQEFEKAFASIEHDLAVELKLDDRAPRMGR